MSRTARPFTVGLVQMRCSTDPDDEPAQGVRGAPRGRRARGAGRLPARALPHAVLLPGGRLVAVRPGRADPRPDDRGARERRAGRRAWSIVGSVFERRTAGIYHNTAVVLDADGALRGLYRKMHIPDDPLYYEKYYFTPGDLGFQAIETEFARVGPLVCWDQWYPEAARLTALRGAEILFYPTAIGWHPAEKAEFGAAQADAWETVQRAHAINNGLFVAAVNRVGHEGPADGGLEFWGGSFLADPFGRVLARAGSGEEILIVACDPRLSEETRRHWPFLRDRRIDAYGPITQRFLDATPPT